VISYVLDLMTSSDRGRQIRLVNKRNVSGFTALAYAAWGGSEAAVRLLLAHGAEPLVINEQVFDPVSLGGGRLVWLGAWVGELGCRWL
jgi:hypothetical protein